MDPSERHDFSGRPRRYDAKRRRVEAAVEGLICRYGLPSDAAGALSEWIYRLCRILVVLKSFDDQDRYYREWRRPARDFAERTANAPDTEPSAYVANMREFAAHMICLETLERRNLGRGKAIEQATKTAELSPKERRKARLYLTRDVPPGDRTRRPAREAEFMTTVANLIEGPCFFQQCRARIEGRRQRAASRSGVRRDDGRSRDGPRQESDQRSYGPADLAH